MFVRLKFSDICTCRTALRVNFLQDFLSQALLHLRVLIQYITREGKQWRSLVQIIKIRWLKGTKIYSLIMVWSIQVFNSVVLSIQFTFDTHLKSFQQCLWSILRVHRPAFSFPSSFLHKELITSFSINHYHRPNRYNHCSFHRLFLCSHKFLALDGRSANGGCCANRLQVLRLVHPCLLAAFASPRFSHFTRSIIETIIWILTAPGCSIFISHPCLSCWRFRGCGSTVFFWVSYSSSW